MKRYSFSMIGLTTFERLSTLLAGRMMSFTSKRAVVISTTIKNTINDTMNMFITRIFNASPEQVWKAWNDEEMVKQWWGPKAFTCPVAKIEFKEGGKTLVCMRAPKEYGGQDMYNTWTYQKIVSVERIEFVLNFTDKDGNKLDPAAIGMPPGIPKDVPHVITFKDPGNNQTELTVTEYGYKSAEVVELSRSGMNECLDKMAEALAKH
jgi:uncharacterized protein YndB with AHSA1/START domain